GLDGAGKTTILYKLKLGDNFCANPTIGFNMESLKVKGANLLVFDVGGQDSLRPLWTHYYDDLKIIITVIDIDDYSRFDLAKSELENVLSSDKLQGVPLLIFANKLDLYLENYEKNIEYRKINNLGRNVLEIEDNIFKRFDCHTISQSRLCKVQPCSAVANLHLLDGLDWVST
ncbi:MAG: hypothetical protein MHPSP_003132, partial [Paramarteilia canceri]